MHLSLRLQPIGSISRFFPLLAYSLLFFSAIDGFGWFWMGNLHKNIHVMLEFLKAPVLTLHFSYCTLRTFPDDVICNIAIYPDDTTLYSKCDQASDL